MKTKATLIAVLLAATGSSWANGGLNINNIDTSNFKPTKAEITELKAQGPLDAFNVKVESEKQVDTRTLKHSYDGRS